MLYVQVCMLYVQVCILNVFLTSHSLLTKSVGGRSNCSFLPILALELFSGFDRIRLFIFI